ncbi:spore gernimation protein KC [Mesobacillus campisalis]|uniref:Spore gernimation protein KC n=1 Tax=Mesobacillus campisalis TaxID=1408103 RepID=A0A0M2SY96_9BACI|nr:Ger(x)C family spore germination protein [Mesobacillus campisalis]KKK38681.1 spore gernimation protein KC [Mesobacillus campisalis]
MKWIHRCLIPAACSLLLSGCWSQKELNDLAIISAMGIDLKEGGGYTATLQIINPANVAGGLQGGGAGTNAPPVSIYTAEGDNIVATNRQATQKLPRIRYYAHTNLLVVSEELARKEGIELILDAIERDAEFRMTSVLVIAQGTTAGELVKVLTPVDKIPANKVIKNLRFAEQQRGEHVTMNVQDIIKDLTAEGKEPVIAGFIIEGDPKEGVALENTHQTEPPARIGLGSLGLFREGKLVDWAEGSAARGTVWILDKLKGTNISIDWEDKQDAVVYEVIRQNTKVTAKLKQGKPAINIQVQAEGNIGETRVQLQLDDPKVLLKLEKAFEKEIEAELITAVEQAQKAKSDVFGFGESIHRSYPEEWKKLKAEWHDAQFPELKVDVTVEAFIRRTGLRNNPHKRN